MLYFFHSFYLNILSVRNLGPAKRRALSKAARVYATEVGACTIRQVPQAATVIDFVVQPQPGFRYFQHSEEQAGRIRISSPSEETVFAIRNLFDKLPDIEHDSEIIRVFSPEHRLIQMYISILRMLPLPLLLPEPSYVRLLQQAIEEAEEGSFTHSVRAIGIAAEELLVEVFETIIREKAPQVPLGNLLKDLNNRLQSIMHGNKAPATADFKTLHKELQTLTNAETKTAHPNPQLVSLVKLIQNSVIPTVNACSQLAASIAKSNPATPKTGLFPPRVQRCVDELVDLRNLVSHRVERASSLTPVGHIDAALAFRDYIAIAVWWLQERTRIDYKADPKAIIEGIISRNRSNASA